MCSIGVVSPQHWGMREFSHDLGVGMTKCTQLGISAIGMHKEFKDMPTIKGNKTVDFACSTSL